MPCYQHPFMKARLWPKLFLFFPAPWDHISLVGTVKDHPKCSSLNSSLRLETPHSLFSHCWVKPPLWFEPGWRQAKVLIWMVRHGFHHHWFWREMDLEEKLVTWMRVKGCGIQGTISWIKTGSLTLTGQAWKGRKKALSALFYKWGSYAQQVFLLPVFLLESHWISGRAWARAM